MLFVVALEGVVREGRSSHHPQKNEAGVPTRPPVRTHSTPLLTAVGVGRGLGRGRGRWCLRMSKGLTRCPRVGVAKSVKGLAEQSELRRGAAAWRLREGS